MKITDEKLFRISVLKERLEALEGLALTLNAGKEAEKESQEQIKALKEDYNSFLGSNEAETGDLCKMFKSGSL